MSIEMVAGTVVSSFLAPLLKSGLDALAGEVGQALGEGAGKTWREKAGAVWDKLRGKFSEGGDEVALEELEANPDDEEAQALVAMKLKRKLAEEPELAAELDELLTTLDKARVTIAGGYEISDVEELSIADARGADFSGSQHARITGKQVGSDAPPRPSPTSDG